MINIILFGPPGSGKGTQAEKLIQEFNLIHISTGDLLRQEITDVTPLGMEAKSFMDQGALVPDEVVIGMISSKLDSNTDANGFIFDGFPRTVAQAEALDKLLSFKNYPITRVLSLQVTEEELVKRLLNRGLTSNRSDDQDESIVRNRIEEYRNKTSPVATYYGDQSKLSEVQGEGSLDDIFQALVAAVQQYA